MAAPTSSTSSSTTAAPTTSTIASTSTSAPVVPGTCPVPPPTRALDPDRPVYDLTADVDVPAGLVQGSTTVAFTPDLPTDVIILRLWANGPRPAAHLEVTAVADAAGAPLPSTQPDPTTLEIALGRTLEAGERTAVTVGFRLQLTGSANDRISRSGDTIRLGSAFPLLAWEPGVGWARPPPTSGFAEAAGSPAADWRLDLTVTPGYEVLTSATVGARDVGISIGRFAANTATAVVDAGRPVEVTVGVDASVAEPAAAYLERVVGALDAMADRYGPYGFDTLTFAITPGLEGGIEYPGHVMQGPATIGRTTPHEVAHQWFYAQVGNDQGRDPWLDEGLASWAEFRHEETIAAAAARDIPADAEGRAGEPMTYWEQHQRSYYRGVYVQPAAALARLGDPALVDCALRWYVAVNAWTIARPAALVEALSAVFPDAATTLAAVGIRA